LGNIYFSTTQHEPISLGKVYITPKQFFDKLIFRMHLGPSGTTFQRRTKLRLKKKIFLTERHILRPRTRGRGRGPSRDAPSFRQQKRRCVREVRESRVSHSIEMRRTQPMISECNFANVTRCSGESRPGNLAFAVCGVTRTDQCSTTGSSDLFSQKLIVFWPVYTADYLGLQQPLSLARKKSQKLVR